VRNSIKTLLVLFSLFICQMVVAAPHHHHADKTKHKVVKQHKVVKKQKVAKPKLYEAASDSQALTMYDYIQKNCRKSCVDSEKLLQTTEEAAKEFNVDQKLLIAVVKVESHFNRLARNGKNGLSVGLTQVQVSWHREKFRGNSYFDARSNIRVGATILSDCMKKHNGNVRRSLMCYNGYSNSDYPGLVITAKKQINQLVDIDNDVI